MHAIVIREPGGPEVLEWVEVPDPVAGGGEVVIEVAAAGLNMADVAQRLGLYPPPDGASPYAGLEVSGRIVEVGAGVTGWAVGDQVCALLEGGGYAERVAVSAGQLPYGRSSTALSPCHRPRRPTKRWRPATTGARSC